MSKPGCLLSLAAATAYLAGPALADTPRAEPRSEFRALGHSLDGAVRRVSRASYLASPSATRSYLLPGIGLIFVLPPQTLPLVRPKQVESPALRGLADATRSIEESLKSVTSPAERARLEQNLRSLRETQAEMASAGFIIHTTTGPDGQLTVETAPLPSNHAALAEAQEFLAAAGQAAMAEAEEMERQFRTMEKQSERFHTETEQDRQEALVGTPDARDDLMRELARRMQQDTELFRVLAEKARAQAEAQVRGRLRGEVAAPAPPEPPEPAPPPWQAFFDFGSPEDARTPDAVIQEVRQAVVRTLFAQAGRMARVRPDEQVMVAVDFLPARRTSLRPTPERTLVIRVPKKSLDDAQNGRLSSEEFAHRVLVSEY